jgi:AcrR family transcriptional regulator
MVHSSRKAASPPIDDLKPRARRARLHDLAVVGRIDRVTAPKQARSERSLQRVLAALEALLKTKPFGEISIPEIAARSECSVATIYGRFKDKHSILAALHESLRERMIVELDLLLDPGRWRHRALDDLIDEFCDKLVDCYRIDRHLLTAVLVLGDREVYERAAQNMEHASRRFVTAMHATGAGRRAAEAESRAHIGIRAAFGLLQQRLLFHPATRGRSEGPSDAVFRAELASLMRMCLRGAAR